MWFLKVSFFFGKLFTLKSYLCELSWPGPGDKVLIAHHTTYRVCLLNSCKISIKIKQVKIEPRLLLAFFSVGPGDVNVFLQRSEYCWSASATFATAPFFIPPPAPSGRPPDWGLGRRARTSPLANPSTVRTLSKMVKIRYYHRCDLLPRSASLLLHLLVKQFDRSAGQLPESGRSLWRVAWTI